MTERAYDTLDIADSRRDDQRTIIAQTGGKHLTIEELSKSLERNGADPALMEAALQLPEEEYHTFEEMFKREARRQVWPKPKLRRG